MAKKAKFELEPGIVSEKTIQVVFQCPESIQKEIMGLSIKEDRTLGRQIVRILREHLRTIIHPREFGGGRRTDG